MARTSIADPIVLAALARAPGYFCPTQIARYTGLKVYAVSSALGRLIHWKKVVYVGSADEAGIRGDGIRASTKFYGLPGTPRLVQPTRSERRTFDFHVRRRDPFAEHARLAMETRR